MKIIQKNEYGKLFLKIIKNTKVLQQLPVTGQNTQVM
jgi:hypothetical protein